MKKFAPLLLLLSGCTVTHIHQEERAEYERQRLMEKWQWYLPNGATNIEEVSDHSDGYDWLEFDYKGKRMLWCWENYGGLVVIGEASATEEAKIEAKVEELKKELGENK